MNPNPDHEAFDAERVDTAFKALGAGNLDLAESVLLSVIGNTPPDYSSVQEDHNGLTIKFWDQAAFLHYVNWHKSQGTANKSIRWLYNAYPRAYFYLGFLHVKQGKFDQAIEFLDKGERLEPTNPLFTLEKAFALVHSGRCREALVLYERVAEIGPFVRARDVATAWRGRGAAFIELGDLDRAETAFTVSLQFEPGNNVAINELLYIKQLRRGGRAASSETVTSTSSDYSTCAVCGTKFQEGIVVLRDGKQVLICKSCEAKHLN
jgi:tetratricopeptide (TPR) repeat protein